MMNRDLGVRPWSSFIVRVNVLVASILTPQDTAIREYFRRDNKFWGQIHRAVVRWADGDASVTSETMTHRINAFFLDDDHVSEIFLEHLRRRPRKD